jgi:hypothetical protein
VLLFIQDQIPYEQLFGTPLNYSLHKIFYCVCFVLLQPHECTKLQPGSQLYCFLGYGLEENGYRCYGPVAKRLRVSRYVVFWEHKMFHSLAPFFECVSHKPHNDPLSDFFLATPSTSNEPVNPTSHESPLSTPTANPINTATSEPHHSSFSPS